MIIEGIYESNKPPSLRTLCHIQLRNLSNKNGVKSLAHLQIITGTQGLQCKNKKVTNGIMQLGTNLMFIVCVHLQCLQSLMVDHSNNFCLKTTCEHMNSTASKTDVQVEALEPSAIGSSPNQRLPYFIFYCANIILNIFYIPYGLPY